jgi:hypothetical protein
MLPTEQILIWQQLFNLLSDLPTDSIPDLKVSLSQAIAFFESEILSQSSIVEVSPSDISTGIEAAARIEDPIAGKMRSYLTESHRLLRLLPVDVMFIAAARNPTTAQQRRQAYQDKLNLLLQYCRAIIESSES